MSSAPYVKFLDYIQALLEQGTFTATYKYALLMAIADVCVEQGASSNRYISYRELAEKMVGYYWPQTRPYRGELLAQSNGRQAAIVNVIAAIRDEFSTPAAFERSEKAASVLIRVARTVREQPVAYLQNVAGQEHQFLYRNEPESKGMRLHPGIPECFRRYHGLIHALCRQGWQQKIISINPRLRELDDQADLTRFLFGSERIDLTALVPILKDSQDGDCLYCHRPLRNPIDVDHFIPRSLYEADWAANLVAAHKGCNADKRDRLAQTGHLGALLQRNERERRILSTAVEVGVPVHEEPLRGVAQWAYSRVERQDAPVWAGKGLALQSLEESWRGLL